MFCTRAIHLLRTITPKQYARAKRSHCNRFLRKWFSYIFKNALLLSLPVTIYCYPPLKSYVRAQNSVPVWCWVHGKNRQTDRKGKDSPVKNIKLSSDGLMSLLIITKERLADCSNKQKKSKL